MLRADLSGVDQVRWANLTVTHRTPVLALCRHLIVSGVDPSSPMTVYRDDRPVLLVSSISAAAKLSVREEPSIRFVPFVPDARFP